MLIAQVLLLVITTIRLVQERVVNQIAGGMTYFAHTNSFYLCTLTGSTFRKESIKLWSTCLPQHRRQRPTTTGPGVRVRLQKT